MLKEIMMKLRKSVQVPDTVVFGRGASSIQTHRRSTP